MDILEILLNDDDEPKAEEKKEEAPDLKAVDPEVFDTLLEEFRSDDKESAREAFRAFLKLAKHLT